MPGADFSGPPRLSADAGGHVEVGVVAAWQVRVGARQGHMALLADELAHGCIPSAAICRMRCSIPSCARGSRCCHSRSWLMSVEAATVSGVTGLVGLGASVRGSTVKRPFLPRDTVSLAVNGLFPV